MTKSHKKYLKSTTSSFSGRNTPSPTTSRAEVNLSFPSVTASLTFSLSISLVPSTRRTERSSGGRSPRFRWEDTTPADRDMAASEVITGQGLETKVMPNEIFATFRVFGSLLLSLSADVFS